MANSNNNNIDEIRELLNERLNYFSDEINKAIRSGLSSKKVAELIRNQEQNILDKFNVRSIEELENLKLSLDKQLADKQREIEEELAKGPNVDPIRLQTLSNEMKVMTDRSNAVCKGIRDIHNGADNLKNVTGLRGFARDAENTVRPLNDIVKGLKDMYGVLRDFNEPWAQASKAASQYAKSVGLAKKGMDALRKSTIDNMVKNHIGINYNVSTDELLKLQENYTKAVGRNVRLSNADQENMAAMRAIIGEGKTTEFATQFENFGFSM